MQDGARQRLIQNKPASNRHEHTTRLAWVGTITCIQPRRPSVLIPTQFRRLRMTIDQAPGGFVNQSNLSFLSAIPVPRRCPSYAFLASPPFLSQRLSPSRKRCKHTPGLTVAQAQPCPALPETDWPAFNSPAARSRPSPWSGYSSCFWVPERCRRLSANPFSSHLSCSRQLHPQTKTHPPFKRPRCCRSRRTCGLPPARPPVRSILAAEPSLARPLITQVRIIVALARPMGPLLFCAPSSPSVDNDADLAGFSSLNHTLKNRHCLFFLCLVRPLIFACQILLSTTPWPCLSANYLAACPSH